MKKIISFVLTLVLCVGLFAALGASAYADEETMVASFSNKFTNTQSGDVTVSGSYLSGDWCLRFLHSEYPFTVSVPENCKLTKVTFNLHYFNRWPYVLDAPNATVEMLSDEKTMVVTFASGDCARSVTVFGLNKEFPSDEDPWQFVDALTVEYAALHTHEKNANDYHAAVAPTCCAGSVEYWGCTNPGCDAKLDASGNVIEDITVPGSGEHSVDVYSSIIHATCTTKGMESGVCSVCQQTVTRETSIDPTAHSVSKYTVTKAATCKAKGEESGECSLCHQTVTRETDIDPNAHNWVNYGSWLRPNYKCSICNVPQSSVTASTLSEGNVWIVVAIAAAAVIAVGAIVVVKKKRVKS